MDNPIKQTELDKRLNTLFRQLDTLRKTQGVQVYLTVKVPGQPRTIISTGKRDFLNNVKNDISEKLNSQ